MSEINITIKILNAYNLVSHIRDFVIISKNPFNIQQRTILTARVGSCRAGGVANDDFD